MLHHLSDLSGMSGNVGIYPRPPQSQKYPMICHIISQAPSQSGLTLVESPIWSWGVLYSPIHCLHAKPSISGGAGMLSALIGGSAEPTTLLLLGLGGLMVGRKR